MLPTKTLKQKTLLEAWYEMKPLVEHLNIFGSIVLVRGIRTLEEIYERCNVAALELTSYTEATVKEG